MSIRKKWLIVYVIALVCFVYENLTPRPYSYLYSTNGGVIQIFWIILGWYNFFALYYFSFRKRGTKYLLFYNSFIVVGIIKSIFILSKTYYKLKNENLLGTFWRGLKDLFAMDPSGCIAILLILGLGLAFVGWFLSLNIALRRVNLEYQRKKAQANSN